MSTKNVVFNKLFKAKTELSKKVDLSLMDDLDAEAIDVLKDADELKTIIDKVEDLRREFNSRFNDVHDRYEDLRERYGDLLYKANELGAKDLGDKAFKAQNDLTNNYSSAGWDGDTLQFFRR
jgi:hypothetical protein